MARWVIFVDIEGFAATYSSNEVAALTRLGGLTRDIFVIGNWADDSRDSRLFAHQIVDGFLIVPDPGEQSLERPVKIAIALLRSSLLRGACLKIAVAVGEFSDIAGCFPQEVIDARDALGRVPLGEGYMNLFPVMGSGHIAAYKTSTRVHGPILAVSSDDLVTLEKGEFSQIEEQDFVLIDWLHADSEDCTSLVELLNTGSTGTNYESGLSNYLSGNPGLPDNWKQEAEKLISGYP